MKVEPKTGHIQIPSAQLEYGDLRQKRGAPPGKDAVIFILVLRVY